MQNKKKDHIPIKNDIEISAFVESLLREIDQQCLPLFEIWDKSSPEYVATFNPIRVIIPILEAASEIEFSGNPRSLLEKLNVPEPRISWFMFRHGLSHSIRPFNIELNGQKFTWGIKQFVGAHHINPENVIIVSPHKLLNDLRQYLETFRYNSKKISIQTGVRFL